MSECRSTPLYPAHFKSILKQHKGIVGWDALFDHSIPVLWIRIGLNADPDPAFDLNSDPDPKPGSKANADPC
jgi:hypothetical protein